MNLPSLKSAAEAAKTSPLELEIWQMEISPDDVLRLVEVARAALSIGNASVLCHPWRELAAIEKALEGIEP